MSLVRGEVWKQVMEHVPGKGRGLESGNRLWNVSLVRGEVWKQTREARWYLFFGDVELAPDDLCYPQTVL